MALLFGSERAPRDDEGVWELRDVCLSVCLSGCQVWWVFDHGKEVSRDTGLVFRTGHRGGVLNEPDIGGNLSVCLSWVMVPSLVGFRWVDPWLLGWLSFRLFWLRESSDLVLIRNQGYFRERDP